ncbi:MAG: insulinase family protein, partial [Myxococcales bacterium]|nr:insulinase family protein [Myxococcales bacterium]
LGEGDLELDVLADALGANGWGRLYKVLVVERELAQRVMVYQGSAQFSGVFHVIVDAKPGADLAEVEKILGDELTRAVREPITEAELKRVVNRSEANFVWGLEELMSRVERLQYFNHFAGDPGYTDTYLARLRAITPAAVQATAAKWLSQPRAEIITMPAPKGKAPRGGEQG